MRNCCRKISGEHLITHAILIRQSHNGTNKVLGIKGQRELIATLPSKSLTANVLCVRCNRALSGVDEVGMRFFETIQQFDSKFQGEENAIVSEEKLFNGEDIERFIIKHACVLIASGNATGINIDPNAPLPEAWISVLFGAESLSPEFGMRILMPQDIMRINDGGMGALVWQADPTNPSTLGVTMFIGGFALWHTPFPRIVPPMITSLRPGSISFFARGVKKRIIFSWDDNEEHADVPFTMD